MPVRWGGAREGAGRKAAARARVWHRGRAEFPESHPGLVTIRVRSDVPSLRTVRLVREVERSLRAIAKRADFRVVHYSLQHDHVHLLVESEGVAALSNGMKSLAARLARAVNRVFDRRGAVLDGRYHHRALGTPREVRAALALRAPQRAKACGRSEPQLPRTPRPGSTPRPRAAGSRDGPSVRLLPPIAPRSPEPRPGCCERAGGGMASSAATKSRVARGATVVAGSDPSPKGDRGRPSTRCHGATGQPGRHAPVHVGAGHRHRHPSIFRTDLRRWHEKSAAT